ncbi:Las1-like-domain-containing protein [Chytridium lagenaria]|nr:Las1-like-domain-containing protein [Chytridium lagenaria]
MGFFRLPRVVPWTTPEEWSQMFAWLFSPDPMQRLIGVKRVKAWSSRGKLPLAVDSTAAFVEVWLRDGLGGSIPSGISEHEIRLMYTMVFIRFVNGMVDPAQKGVFAASVVSVAESLGLPAWFVDLRHAGTHDHLPTIAVLRSGCNQALQWLHDNYWMQQQLYMKDTFTEVKSLLSAYQETFAKSKKNADPKSQEGLKILADLTSFILADSYRDFLIPTLLEPGYLIPSSKLLQSSYPSLNVNEGRAAWWSRAIDWFDQQWQGFLEEFLLAIINMLSEPSVDDVEPTDPDAIPPIRYMSSLDSRTALLQSLEDACLRNPNRFTHQLVLRILEKEGRDKESYAPMLNYMKSLATFESRHRSPSPIPTVDDMANELKLLYDRIEHAQRLVRSGDAGESVEAETAMEDVEMENGDDVEGGTVKGPWKVASHMDWRRAPLGCDAVTLARMLRQAGVLQPLSKDQVAVDVGDDVDRNGTRAPPPDTPEPSTPEYTIEDDEPTPALYLYQGHKFSSLSQEEVEEVMRKVKLM